jgi:FAD/FMN-containing dehydrogenase
MQSDNVLEMEVVTGKGEKVTCSPNSNADLFNAVRAGLGQVAVITRATLTLIPAPQQVRRFLLIYRDLNTMLKDERLLAADNRFEAVQGRCFPHRSAGGRLGWTPRSSSPGTHQTTTHSSPACPTTGPRQS